VKQGLGGSPFASGTPGGHSDYLGLPPCEAEVCIASKMKLWGVLGVWG